MEPALNRLSSILMAIAALGITSTAAAQTSTGESVSESSPKGRALSGGEREQLKRELLSELEKDQELQREAIRDEVRAQLATQAANRARDDDFEFSEQKRRLELLSLDGYLRLRPELFYKLSMGRGRDPQGNALYPYPNNREKTHADANMRWRLEPTLNISEDVRIRSQLDVLDNVILGSTPAGGELGNAREPLSIASQQTLSTAIELKRVYGEVNTPVGLLSFGRMGSHWGTGMLTHSGNCLDCDYGDTVDRIMFVSTRIGGHYIVPMLDFVSEGVTQRHRDFGVPYDANQSDDARDWGLAIAKRDTELEITRKLGADQSILNYGLYFVYRSQRFDTAKSEEGTSFQARDASIYVPDLWAKFQTNTLTLEFELAGVFGNVNTLAPLPGSDDSANQAITLAQVGFVAKGEYMALASLGLGLEVGFASGDEAPGMGNRPGSGVPTAGSLDGAQFCVAANCATRDDRITNFRFNRDYRVDLILWRELFQGVTDALYVKPGLRYELTDGLGLWTNIVYSRAMEATSTPSSRISSSGKLEGDANLGIEFDAGIRYDSGDGFGASLSYGVLFPLAGLDNHLPETVKHPTSAQAVRAAFTLKY